MDGQNVTSCANNSVSLSLTIFVLFAFVSIYFNRLRSPREHNVPYFLFSVFPEPSAVLGSQPGSVCTY